MNEIKWSGWELSGVLLIKPRRVRLAPAEARILRALMTHRLQQAKLGQGNYGKENGPTVKHLAPNDLRTVAEIRSLDSLRSWVSNLRDAVGRNAIITERGLGYLLRPVNDRHAATASPIDELVLNLMNALAAAKRLQKSIKEGLYHE